MNFIRKGLEGADSVEGHYKTFCVHLLSLLFRVAALIQPSLFDTELRKELGIQRSLSHLYFGRKLRSNELPSDCFRAFSADRVHNDSKHPWGLFCSHWKNHKTVLECRRALFLERLAGIVKPTLEKDPRERIQILKAVNQRFWDNYPWEEPFGKAPRHFLESCLPIEELHHVAGWNVPLTETQKRTENLSAGQKQAIDLLSFGLGALGDFKEEKKVECSPIEDEFVPRPLSPPPKESVQPSESSEHNSEVDFEALEKQIEEEHAEKRRKNREPLSERQSKRPKWWKDYTNNYKKEFL